MYKIKGLQKHS